MKIYVLIVNWHDNEPSIYIYKNRERAENWKRCFYESLRESGSDLKAEVIIEERFFED